MILARNGKGCKPGYDYPAPAHMIYWGARQKMVALGRLEPGDEVEFLTYKKGFTYALLQSDDPDAKYIPPMRGHFYDTRLETRDYPFTDRCSRYVAITETLKVPSGYTRVSTPQSQQFVTPAISFEGGYTVGYNMVTFTENISLGKRVYEASEWPSFRKAVQCQRGYMGAPVVFVK